MASIDDYAAELERLYSNRFTAAERVAKERVWKTLHDSFFCRYIPKDATVLDLGAGYCELINCVEAGRRIAVDLNPETVRSAAPGVEVHSVNLNRLGDCIEPASVDVAFASNVFEHLRGPEILLEVLAAVREALRPGGLLIVMQPNVRAVRGAFWDFVDHTLPLTERGMAEAMELSGLQVVEVRPKFLPYTVKGKLPTASFFVRLYLAFPPAHRLIGKQMLVVARRPT